eukprot:TCALIF_06227-PA protein Name:"Protein of unknown function" AED:0.11 eAED:0.11 QI:73/1/0/1/1/1/2/20/81
MHDTSWICLFQRSRREANSAGKYGRTCGLGATEQGSRFERYFQTGNCSRRPFCGLCFPLGKEPIDRISNVGWAIHEWIKLH